MNPLEIALILVLLIELVLVLGIAFGKPANAGCICDIDCFLPQGHDGQHQSPGGEP